MDTGQRANDGNPSEATEKSTDSTQMSMSCSQSSCIVRVCSRVCRFASTTAAAHQIENVRAANDDDVQRRRAQMMKDDCLVRQHGVLRPRNACWRGAPTDRWASRLTSSRQLLPTGLSARRRRQHRPRVHATTGNTTKRRPPLEVGKKFGQKRRLIVGAALEIGRLRKESRFLQRDALRRRGASSAVARARTLARQPALECASNREQSADRSRAATRLLCATTRWRALHSGSRNQSSSSSLSSSPAPTGVDAGDDGVHANSVDATLRRRA